MEVPKRNKAIFTSPDEKERVIIKKAVISALSNPTSVKCPKINFTEAVLKEPPMYFSMPKECIEKLRKAYSESIKNSCKSEDEGCQDVMMEVTWTT